jgi:GTP cyclohydrolase I
MSQPNQTISARIKGRLLKKNKRFFVNDNISDCIYEEEVPQLIDEVADKFEQVLQSLVIDTENDPNSKDTARRLAKMYCNELFCGRYFPPPEVTSFPNDKSHGSKSYRGMLVVRSEINSICSHHHQPVVGIAYIGVIPTEKVIGLSKYSRIAQHCARRGTLQEELCNDIATEIMNATESENVAVHIAAEHGCCTNRGIMAKSSMTQTTVLHGMFYMADARKEFFDNIKMQGGFGAA